MLKIIQKRKETANALWIFYPIFPNTKKNTFLNEKMDNREYNN